MKNKLLVIAGTLLVAALGVKSMLGLSVDAVPDITNNQVQVVTSAPTLAAGEIEEMITFPVETAVSNIPNVTEVRSISRYGLSVVTVVFVDDVPTLEARQFISEQLKQVDIPDHLGTPELMPVSTGLGEIYQYVLSVEPGFEDHFNLMELRTLQDWIVKRMMAGTEGIIEVSSFGGLVKQYEVSVNPSSIAAYNITIDELFEAISKNNANSGGSYLEKGKNAFYIRTEGRAESLDQLRQIIVATRDGVPVTVGMVGKVGYGAPKRYGAMTMDGKGEVVGGITLMLKGASSSDALAAVHDRMAEIQQALPEGVRIYPYLDRSVLVGKTIDTVQTNLLEGGIIVIMVLLLLLGDWKAGLVVASVIPFSLLIAFILMEQFGVSANLMSLGAVDFGIVVDGAVIVVEGILAIMHHKYLGRKLSMDIRDREIRAAATRIYQSAVFGVFIILIVFVPVLMLEGIEGKMFRPMALTVGFAIIGSLILSLTYVPVMASLFLTRKIKPEAKWVVLVMRLLRKGYDPLIGFALNTPVLIVLLAVPLLVLSFMRFGALGSEFIPTLEEGDLAMQLSIEPGSSLDASIAATTSAEKILKANFPEVKHVVSKIGTAEVPTDPMAIEDADVMIILKDRSEWVTTDDRETLIAKMKESLQPLEESGVSMEFTQPIQLRFNELMTGAKTDIAVKFYGSDPEMLRQIAERAAEIIRRINGAGDVKVEQTDGLKQLSVVIDRPLLSTYGVDAEQVNTAIRTAYAGEVAGYMYEDERRFELVVRADKKTREELRLSNIHVRTASGDQVPLSVIARVEEKESPMQISHENASRKITVGVNVRNRDVASLVADIQKSLEKELEMPSGYYVRYGGQFENLQHAVDRLMIVVPFALLLILLLLYLAVGSLRDALIIFLAVPFSAIGGIWMLDLRGMPFSISAGIGFIALFGVAVLNGLVMISEVRRLRKEAAALSGKSIIHEAALSRLRPVLMTALVAALGFLPMALSTGNGAVVQRPLASVVIGGLISSTILTLLVLPAIYLLVSGIKKPNKTVLLGILLLFGESASAQPEGLTLDSLLERSDSYPGLRVHDERQNIWEARKEQGWLLPPMEIQVQYGQINYGGADYNAQFLQPLGNPFNRQKIKAWATQGEILSESNRLAALTTIKQEVHALYFRIGMLKAMRQDAENLFEELQELDRIIEEQFDQGAISRLEAESIRLLIYQQREILAGIRMEAAQAEVRLRMLTNLRPDETVSWPDNFRLAVEQIHGADSTSIWLEPSAQSVLLKDAEIAVTRRSYIPEPSVGGFTQSLENDQGFSGIMIGFSWPIIGTGKRRKLQELQYERNELQWKLTTDSLELSARKEQLRSKLKVFNEVYPNDWFNFASLNAAIDDALAQFRKGAIGHLELSQALTLLNETRLRRMELIDNWNQMVIELNYLTK